MCRPPTRLGSSILIALCLLLSAGSALAEEPIYLWEWGSSGNGSGQFQNPHGVALAWTGFFYVADTGNHRIQKFDESGTYLLEWGSQGSGAGEFDEPWDVVTDDNGNVYVTDRGNHRVQKFDENGVFLSEWGSLGTGAGEFDSPTGLGVDAWDQLILVADTGNDRIQIFDLDGTWMKVIGSSGSSPGQLNAPMDVATAGSGEILVCDTANDRIQQFTPGGVVVLIIGSTGSGLGELDAPEGIWVDCAGKIIVADTGNDRIQRFDDDGNFLDSTGGTGSGPGQFSGPVSVASFRIGFIVGKRPLSELLVLDSNNGRVQVFEGSCCGFGMCVVGTASVSSTGGTLRISPAGTGPTLADAGATVEVFITDCCDNPVAHFPYQDIWLDDAGTGDINLCRGGGWADADTDADGRTTISGAIAGGGWTKGGMYVYVSGVPIDSGPLDIRANSPDIDGDLAVALTDVGMFASDLGASPAPFRSDLKPDGVIDLADVGIFATHIGEVCP